MALPPPKSIPSPISIAPSTSTSITLPFTLMVPFVLRWLHAELPHRLGQTSVTIERLYALFDRCQRRLDRLQAVQDPTDVAGTVSAAGKELEVDSDSRGACSEATVSDEHHDPGRRSIQNDTMDSHSPEQNEPSEPPGLDGSGLDPFASPDDSQGPKEKTSVEELSSKNTNGDSIERKSEFAEEMKGFVEGIASNSLADRSDSLVSDPGFGVHVSGTTSSSDDLRKPSERDGDWTSVSSTNVLKRWQHRQEIVINCIVSHHLNKKDFTLALKWFKQLLQKHPTDPWLLSKLAYVQMQLGDLTGAKDTCLEVEKIAGHATMRNSLQSSYLKGLICRNRGLLHLVQKQYTEAIKEFDSAIEVNPVDVLSANSKALCLMYTRDLIGSTKVLESVLDKAPLVALNESLVLNLCSMYELAFVNNVQTKKTLSDWILQIAPDDFDLSCTRL